MSEKSLSLVWSESLLRDDERNQASVFSGSAEIRIQITLGNSLGGQQLMFTISIELAVSAHTYTPRGRNLCFIDPCITHWNGNHPSDFCLRFDDISITKPDSRAFSSSSDSLTTWRIPEGSDLGWDPLGPSRSPLVLP